MESSAELQNDDTSAVDIKADAFDLLSTAVLILDANRIVTAMNPAAEGLLGISEQRAVGADVRELFVEDGKAATSEMLALFEAPGGITRRAASFSLRDGHSVKADVTISPDPVGAGVIVELQPLNRLIRINRDDHALASLKTAQELVRSLAHEVKNPLGGLRGAAQLLERELADPALKEYTEVIINEADRLKDLVDRMLGPNQQPSFKNLNVHLVLEHVVRLVQAEFPGQLTVLRDYDPSVPDVSADHDQLIQALLNIVRNAAQILADAAHSVAHPEILLRTRVVRSFTIGGERHRLVAQIDIIDNGPGISEEMLERIFFPMIGKRADGTGLGLAITQNIIDRHHGVIECESEPQHTCFSVFLPLEMHNDD